MADCRLTQEDRYEEFLRDFYFSKPQQRLVVIELGAGLAVSTIRRMSESIVEQSANATLIRINPRDADVPRQDHPKYLSVPLGGLDALQQIDTHLTPSL